MSFKKIHCSTIVLATYDTIRDWLYAEFEAQGKLSLLYIYERITIIHGGPAKTIHILRYLMANNIITRVGDDFMLLIRDAPINDQLWFNHLLI